MENELDSHAVTSLAAPGIHRLNRTEYQNVIRDLLGLKIDAARFLPSDNSTHGFDNIAGALTMSPALMEAYLSAAGKISRLAMASNTAPTFVEFNVPDDATQNYHVEGLPFGTRGGIADRARVSGRRRVRVQDRSRSSKATWGRRTTRSARSWASGWR